MGHRGDPLTGPRGCVAPFVRVPLLRWSLRVTDQTRRTAYNPQLITDDVIKGVEGIWPIRGRGARPTVGCPYIAAGSVIFSLHDILLTTSGKYNKLKFGRGKRWPLGSMTLSMPFVWEKQCRLWSSSMVDGHHDGIVNISLGLLQPLMFAHVRIITVYIYNFISTIPFQTMYPVIDLPFACATSTIPSTINFARLLCHNMYLVKLKISSLVSTPWFNILITHDIFNISLQY